MLMANGEKLCIDVSYTWSDSGLGIVIVIRIQMVLRRLLLSTHTHKHTLSLVAFSGEKGIFQSRHSSHENYTQRTLGVLARYIFYTVVYLAVRYVRRQAGTMGIYNDADAEVIYLCTNSANTTPPPPPPAIAILRIKCIRGRANEREKAKS